MAVWSLQFRVETPALTTGARQSPELRLTAVLAGLRAAWRMTAPHRLLADAKRLRQEEGAIFGWSASEKADGGQGLFVADMPVVTGSAALPAGTKALLPNNVRTQCVPAETAFRVRLIFPRVGSDSSEAAERTERLAALKRAIEWFGAVGAIGFACRRGFGSVSLQKIEGVEDVEIAHSEDAHERLLRRLFCASAPNPAALPRVRPFPHVDANTRMWLIREQSGLDKLAASVSGLGDPAHYFSDQHALGGNGRHPSPLLIHLRRFEDRWTWTLLLSSSDTEAATRAAAFATHMGATEVTCP